LNANGGINAPLALAAWAARHYAAPWPARLDRRPLIGAPPVGRLGRRPGPP